MYGTVFWTLWEKARVGCFKRTAWKHVYYLGWNRSPAQVGCMRQALRPGALGRPRGIGWRGRWEGGSGWGTHVNPWLIHFNVWQNPLQKNQTKPKQTTTTKKQKPRKLFYKVFKRHNSLHSQSFPHLFLQIMVTLKAISRNCQLSCWTSHFATINIFTWLKVTIYASGVSLKKTAGYFLYKGSYFGGDI